MYAFNNLKTRSYLAGRIEKNYSARDKCALSASRYKVFLLLSVGFHYSTPTRIHSV